MKALVMRTGRKPAPKNLVARPQRSDLRGKLLLILLRDLIPTAIILISVGWLALQIASFIAKDRPVPQLVPAVSSRP
ncbi:hypothetical protein [Geoalkalibacter sp.]|uniref:hypothetical protein n=1 Tax=Geoalkalibacter sp. TaxID=3041440 RepID=UPI00272E167C|nr:hypothetical protein [Geoalkalibacter sp.]